MKKKTHEVLLDSIWNQIKRTRNAGQKEYAQDNDNCFANFERIANLQGLKREQILLTYLFKHIDGISSYVKGHHSQREDVRGRITDAIVYLTLLWGMIDQNEHIYELSTTTQSTNDEKSFRVAGYDDNGNKTSE